MATWHPEDLQAINVADVACRGPPGHHGGAIDDVTSRLEISVSPTPRSASRYGAHARGTRQLPTLPHLRPRRLWPVMAVVVAILGVG